MNRSGYVEQLDDYFALGRWRAAVERAIRGKRGQVFLRELADAMDAMEEKVLIADDLIDEDGYCCAIGVVCKSRGLDVTAIDYEDPQSVGDAVGIARAMAAEIEFENDLDFCATSETPEQRWKRMRKWVESHLIAPNAAEA